MAVQPEGFKHLTAEVRSVKGHCSAGHKVGEVIKLGCWDSGGLCGFFYHDVFPTISVMQFGGRYPWESEEGHMMGCPDTHNQVTIRLTRPE